MEKLWAPWRLEYVSRVGNAEACVFCAEAADTLGEDSLVVHRSDHAFVVLNRYPYASGHVLVCPYRHIAGLDDLTSDEAPAIHALTVEALAVIRRVYGPDAFNVGWNLGAVAGGSIAAHLHEHVVPRWAGDTNFMPVLADVKVVPEHLATSRDRLRAAWPAC
ncbi:MAG: HIT domain-containing protein [Thermoleophilia bacterium]|nr:HIT domain-containing protein [Thermoleophilia bacterium]